MSAFTRILRRDLRTAWRRPSDALQPVAFFVAAASLFPLGVGPEPQTLRQIAPGVIWVSALLAAMLSVQPVFASDLADGSLEQMMLSSEPLVLTAFAKAAAHWLTSAGPLLLAAPLMGGLFGLPAETIATLLIALAIGTPVLSLLGTLAAALTLGLRQAGLLILVIVLPLAMPVLVFGAGAVGAVETGLPAVAHQALLGALLALCLPLAPLATAAALRISME
jgi:heme exporter protein B